MKKIDNFSTVTILPNLSIDKLGNIVTVEKQTILEKIVELMNKDNLPNPQNLRKIDRVRLKEKTKLVDEVLSSVQTSNITEDKKLVKCGALVITQLLGIKEIRNKKKEEPFWKRRIRDRNFEKGKSED